MSIQRRKVAIIGVGRVGSHVASCLVTRSLVDDLVLIDTDTQKVQSHCQDLADATAFLDHNMQLECGSYDDISDADIVVLAASGPIFKENRLEELDSNIEVVDEIASQLSRVGFNGVIISITNPCDVVAQYLSTKVSAPVIGTGTLLDSARFRSALSRELHMSPKDIQAYSLGEHGDSQVLAFSAISIMGKPLTEWQQECVGHFEHVDFVKIEKEVIGAGWDIVMGKGATEFGIGSVTAELIDAIYRDSGRILPCSTLLKGEYGQEGVYASIPCVIGHMGVRDTMPITLSAHEQNQFVKSCDIMRHYFQQIS
ncbi:L-lactate dehydrogenase [Vibrio sp.]|uniref:L-lactate dehydrogenase n=1 Tax=Vibrio viridaestus TaxID=2487322 RepID=A0A3N9TZE8_9VIBR|nr:L-lactate dehydrogenase [Vibrio viridaestus]MDC0609185.1 L-lactate dehydrogenase [Vibrio sp.]RQW62342.1 L-lactate dehydrogenase [Vibrio viridaestus]